MSEQLTVKDFKSDLRPVWCPGCGDYGVLTPFLQALVATGKDPMNTVIVSGIGCSGRFPYFCSTYGFHGVHGRAVPTALGMKAAAPNLDVFAVGGDGDGLGIGGGHLPHAARKNVDMVYVLINNNIYGLTKGQSSPTSPITMVSKTAPYENIEDPLNPVEMFMAYGTSFVGVGFSGQPKQLKDIFTQAIEHKGFSIVLVHSPCTSFNKQVTFESMKAVFAPVAEDHDPADKWAAMKLAMDTDRMWTGVLYRQQRPTLQDRLEAQAGRAGKYENFQQLLDKYV
jgi:2-oxoglutarate ferredoxin oxidoreductase subunit beta